MEKTLESHMDCKEIQPVHSKEDQQWVFFGRNDGKDATPVLWPPHAKSWLIGKDWCLEGLEAGGKGNDRGWDGWMASLTRWTWIWVNSGRWWWTGRPGMLWFMGSQRVTHDWATELNWILNRTLKGQKDSDKDEHSGRHLPLQLQTTSWSYSNHHSEELTGTQTHGLQERIERAQERIHMYVVSSWKSNQ